jgi:hypothetical protein
VRFALPILFAAVVAGVAGYRAGKLRSVQAVMPAWLWRLFWIAIATLFLMVPLLWWLDF